MEYCVNCGHEIKGSENVCPYCGAILNSAKARKAKRSSVFYSDNLVFVFFAGVAGFCLPVLALVFFAISKHKKTKLMISLFASAIVSLVIILSLYIGIVIFKADFLMFDFLM